MSDGVGRPLMTGLPCQLPPPAGTQAGLRAIFTVAGWPLLINNWMPDVAPDSTPLFFGNPRELYQLITRKAVAVMRDPYSFGFCVGFRFEARVGGKIRHEHIKGLGSIAIPASAVDRIAFWAKVHAVLAVLSNRIDAQSQGEILASLHARIPMPTADEQRAVQRKNAEAVAQHWEALQRIHGGAAEDQRQLRETVDKAIAHEAAAEADAAVNAMGARDRIAQIDRGETVSGGLRKPKTDLEATLLAAGWTPAKIRMAQQLADLPHEWIKSVIGPEISKEIERVRRLVIGRIWRGAKAGG